MAALQSRPLRPARLRPRTRRVLVATVVVIAVAVTFLVVVLAGSRAYDLRVRNPNVCAPPAAINRVLGTGFDQISVLHETDLVSCSYGTGPDLKALSLVVAVPNDWIPLFGFDPCGHGPDFTVAGHRSCDASHTAYVPHGGVSLVVETGALWYQFTSDSKTAIDLSQLEKLAVATFAPPMTSV